MTSSSPLPPESSGSSTKARSGKGGGTKSFGFVDKAKLFLIVVLLILLAGAGGYFFGTQQQFAPVQKGGAGNTATPTQPAAGQQTSSGEQNSSGGGAQAPTASGQTTSGSQAAATSAALSGPSDAQPGAVQGVAPAGANTAGTTTSTTGGKAQTDYSIPPALKNGTETAVTRVQPTKGLKNKYWVHLNSGDGPMVSLTVNGALVNIGGNIVDITPNVRAGDNKLSIDVHPPVGAPKSVDLQVLCGPVVSNDQTDATILLKYYKAPGPDQGPQNFQFADHG